MHLKKLTFQAESQDVEKTTYLTCSPPFPICSSAQAIGLPFQDPVYLFCSYCDDGTVSHSLTGNTRHIMIISVKSVFTFQ